MVHRKAGLDATEEIARHPIRATKVNFRVSGVLKTKDAAVLQEAAHQTAHDDIIAYPRYTGSQAANASHKQIDSHARLRCAIERLDYLLVDQRVDLCK